MGEALGVHGTVRMVPDWTLRAIGPAVPFVGAAAEMPHQWKVPCAPDDRHLREAFGVAPTPAAEAVAATAAWIRGGAGAGPERGARAG